MQFAYFDRQACTGFGLGPAGCCKSKVRRDLGSAGVLAEVVAGLVPSNALP